MFRKQAEVKDFGLPDSPELIKKNKLTQEHYEECNTQLTRYKSEKISRLANQFAQENLQQTNEIFEKLAQLHGCLTTYQSMKTRRGTSIELTLPCMIALQKRETNRKAIGLSTIITAIPAAILILMLGASTVFTWPFWLAVGLVGAYCFYHARKHYKSLTTLDHLAIACVEQAKPPQMEQTKGAQMLQEMRSVSAVEDELVPAPTIAHASVYTSKHKCSTLDTLETKKSSTLNMEQ